MCSQISQSLPDTCPAGSQSQLTPAETLTPVNNVKSSWGFLYSCVPAIPYVALSKDSYVIGRALHCERNLHELGETIWSQISKEHFRIRRVSTGINCSDGAVYIDDLSSNGTFINEIRLGKGKSRLLRNNDRISCVIKKQIVFVYMDHDDANDSSTVSECPKTVLSRYAISYHLGSGAYGQVRLVFEKNSGRGYAMKIIQKNKFTPSVVASYSCDRSNKIQREIDILKKLQHAFVIKFHDVVDEPHRVFLVTELVSGGQLFDRILGGRPLPEADAKYFFYQLALAIKYLHSEGIIHRDIKLENILLTSNSSECIIKLADFGLSKFVDAESMLRTYCGTPMYIAPEVLLSQGEDGSYDTQADIWSMGVVLYMCLSGTSPFSQKDSGWTLTTQVLRGYYSFPEKYWRNVSCDAIRLVRCMLTVNPKKRITIDSILSHVWLKDDEMKKRVRDAIAKDSSTPSQNLENEEPVAKRPRHSTDNVEKENSC